MIKSVNNSNFKETINNNDVVLVDFYAEWCGPCKALHPVLESVATDFEGKAVISKINVDQNPELSQQFGVRSIPSLFYFQNGKLIEHETGYKSKEEITDKLTQLLSN